MSLKKNVVANYFGQGWTALMGVLFVPLYIKYLGAEAYGLIGISAMLQAFLALLNLGMTPALSREMARFTGGSTDVQDIRNLLRSIECLAIVLGICFALTVWSLSGWIASEWINVDKISVTTAARALSLMGVVVACFLFQNVYNGSLVGLQRQVALNGVAATMTTIRVLGAVVILIWISPTVEAFFIWQATMAIANAMVYAMLVYRTLPKGEGRTRFSPDALKRIWRFSGAMAGTSAAAIVLNNIDRVILSKQLSLEMFGYYSLAKVVAANILALAYPITTAVYPRMIELIEQKKAAVLSSVYHSSAQVLSTIVISAAVVIVFYAEKILMIWTQDAEVVSKTYHVVQLLTAGSVLYSMIYLPLFLEIAHGRVKVFLYYQILSIPCLILVIMALAHFYGVIGAACVWLVRGLVTMAILPHLMSSELLDTEKMRWYLEDIAYPMAASSLVVLATKVLVPMPESQIGEIAVLVVVSALSLTSAAMAAKIIRHRVFAFVSRFATSK